MYKIQNQINILYSEKNHYQYHIHQIIYTIYYLNITENTYLICYMLNIKK